MPNTALFSCIQIFLRQLSHHDRIFLWISLQGSCTGGWPADVASVFNYDGAMLEKDYPYQQGMLSDTSWKLASYALIRFSRIWTAAAISFKSQFLSSC